MRQFTSIFRTILNVNFTKIGYFYERDGRVGRDSTTGNTPGQQLMAALVNLSTIFKVIFSRRARVVAPDPLSLVIEPAVDLTVKRTATHVLLVRWTFPADQVELYASTSPTERGDLLPVTPMGNEVTISGLDRATRHYFTLKVRHGGRTWERHVAERALPLETGVNFRDIGGYPTAAGKHTRWGLLYRSGSFSHLTEFDQAYLRRMGFKLVCDLRSDQEVEQNPDVLPDADTAYWHHPLFTHRESQEGVRRFLLSVNDADKMKNALQESYTQDMIDHKGPLFGEIMRRFADPTQLPMAFHCTAGKDRTGVTTALLLAVLGVPEEIIVADYSISNLFNATFRTALKNNTRGLRILRLTQDDLMPLLLAHPDTMRGTLHYVRENYGTYERYLLTQAGLDEPTISQLRALLLQ